MYIFSNCFIRPMQQSYIRCQKALYNICRPTRTCPTHCQQTDSPEQMPRNTTYRRRRDRQENPWQRHPLHHQAGCLEAAGTLQLCVGQEAESEAAIHAMCHIFEDAESEAVLLVNASNAFNSLNHRAAGLERNEKREKLATAGLEPRVSDCSRHNVNHALSHGHAATTATSPPNSPFILHQWPWYILLSCGLTMARPHNCVDLNMLMLNKLC